MPLFVLLDKATKEVKEEKDLSSFQVKLLNKKLRHAGSGEIWVAKSLVSTDDYVMQDRVRCPKCNSRHTKFYVDSKKGVCEKCGNEWNSETAIGKDVESKAEALVNEVLSK
jgi:hypothetical protein